jgi:hypothetical protein
VPVAAELVERLSTAPHFGAILLISAPENSIMAPKCGQPKPRRTAATASASRSWSSGPPTGRLNSTPEQIPA